MRLRPTTKAALSLVLGLAALATVSACGGASSSGTATTAPASSAAGAGNAGFAAYRDCMSQNGVTLPEGGPVGTPPSGLPTAMPTGTPPSGAPNGPGQLPLPDGVDQQTFDAAQQACASVLPQFGQGGPGPVDQTAVAAFTSCLSDHGVTLPSGPDGFRTLDRSDPDVQSALDTCAPLMPAPGGGASPAAS